MAVHHRLARIFGLLATGALIALLVVSAACGGGDDDDDATPTESATEEPTEDASGSAEPEVVQIEETFWHSGFMVTLNEAAYSGTEDDFGEVEWTVAIDATFENLGPDTDSFPADMVLLSGGDAWQEISRDSDIPSVPGELAQDGTIIFVVDDTFDFADASLQVGSADQQQASVPFGPGGGDLVALEPEQPPVTGQIALTLITLDFDGSELRADLPSTHEEIDAGKLHLSLSFAATSRNNGNWSVNTTDFALTLPDGTSVPAFSGGNVSLPGNVSGLTTEDLAVGFEVDDPAAGEYSVRFTPGSWWFSNGAEEEGSFSFTIE